VRIAARTAAEHHDPFDPIAVKLIEGGAERAAGSDGPRALRVLGSGRVTL
jgi:hypothetical protein